jgi:hypothetical protein
MVEKKQMLTSEEGKGSEPVPVRVEVPVLVPGLHDSRKQLPVMLIMVERK